MCIALSVFFSFFCSKVQSLIELLFIHKFWINTNTNILLYIRFSITDLYTKNRLSRYMWYLMSAIHTPFSDAIAMGIRFFTVVVFFRYLKLYSFVKSCSMYVDWKTFYDLSSILYYKIDIEKKFVKKYWQQFYLFFISTIWLSLLLNIYVFFYRGVYVVNFNFKTKELLAQK